jgi:hypothetical protein
MATKKQVAAAKRNIKKAARVWKSMSHREHALAQPQGRGRAKPGTVGKGKFYRIVLRPKEEFVLFRNQDVGRSGHIERLAGKRANGRWATQSWLISKQDAHRSDGTLVGDTAAARKVLGALRTKPKLVKGDIFAAKDRRNIPEREKPTPRQRKAQAANIKKAQQTWKKMHAA